MRPASLRTRIALLVLVLLLGVQLAGFGLIHASIERNARAEVARQLEVAHRVFARLLAHEAQTLGQAARVLAADYGFRSAVAGDDRETLGSALENHGARIDATVAMFWGADGGLRASTATPDPTLAGHVAELVRRARETDRDRVDGAALVGDRLLRLVVVPVRAPATIGWVAMGFPIDRSLAADLRSLSSVHVSFVAIDGPTAAVLSSTLPEADARALAARPRAIGALARGAASLTLRGADWGAAVAPIPVQAGTVVQAVLQRPVAEAIAPYEQLQTTLLALTLAGMLASGAISVLSARRMLHPLALLARAAQRLGAGDASTPLPPSGDDEVGRLSGAFSAMRTALAEREARIARLAFFDETTSLPNRAAFVQRLAAARSPGTVLLLDLDRFKRVNDVLGHAYGDLVLAAVARRVEARATQAGAFAARVGGDEFGLLLRDRSPAAALALARALADDMRTPVTIEGQPVDVASAIGIALADDGCTRADATPLARAEVALYAAKRRGVDAFAWTAALDEGSARSVSLGSELRAAIAAEGLSLAFQPKLRLSDGALAGVEVLLRWHHPERGWIPPDRFMPFAERTGLVREITRWVLAHAIAQAADWADAGRPVPIAVNLSTRDLLDGELPARVAAALAGRSLSPALLTLEITESAVMDDPERALQVLAALRALGVKLSIDDYGTGHASLAYLKRLPVHELKIDRAFTRSMLTEATDATIVRSTIELGHRLGLTLVAEGIEDEATATALRAAGCDVGQGWHYGRPMDAPALAAWLDARTTGRVAVAPGDPDAAVATSGAAGSARSLAAAS